MMQAYVDPVNGNQVMAIYSHETDSSHWTDQGYVAVGVPEEFQADITRDHAATVADGVVTGLTPSANPVQPGYSSGDRRRDLRELADTRKALERLRQEASEGHIPSRASDGDVDAVMAAMEDKLADLRSRISET